MACWPFLPYLLLKDGQSKYYDCQGMKIFKQKFIKNFKQQQYMFYQYTGLSIKMF